MPCATRRGGRETIEFVDMPDALRGQYQSFTEARMDRLRAAGYDRDTFTRWRKGVQPLRAGPPRRDRSIYV